MKPIKDKAMHRNDCLYARGAPLADCNCARLSTMPKVTAKIPTGGIGYLYRR